MTDATLLTLTLLIPLAGTILIGLTGRNPNLREGVTLTTAVLLFAVVLLLLLRFDAGAVPYVKLQEVMPGLDIALKIEPLGMMFSLIASGLWILNSIYSIGYMRENKEQNQTRFYMCFAIAILSALGIAFAANMFTLFIFYEVLTISTYPLVTHKQTPESKASGRVYLGLLLGTSIGLQMVAIIWTWVATGTLDFTKGGILDGKLAAGVVPLLLALYMFGIGKAALMPFHRWLPAAMVAPTPVSALLHAVAVVKAGVFTVMKVIVYIFGIDFLAKTGGAEWLMWVAAFTVLTASLIALRKDNLKARLAYSTVSQLSYVTLGAALATSMGVIGGSMHIAMHAVGKITLFFCAGAIYTATHKTEISDMDGLGRIMPFTYGAFLIGALSIIGLPPMGGSWSKWYLMLGAAETGQLIMIAVLMLSSLLNVAYLLPVVGRGFFAGYGKGSAAPLPQPAGAQVAPGAGMARIKEAPLFCLIPPMLTAAGCVALFFYADKLYRLLEPMVRP
jgi:multicomponent Na+:H+ antiporter subunit D